MDYKEALQANMHHFYSLNAIMEKHGWPKGGGSYLVNGQNLNYDETTFAKQELYFNTVKSFEEPDIIEIGVYAAHSCLIALIANPNSFIVGIDPGYSFTKECVEYLNEQFGKDSIILMEENSHDALPKIGGLYEVISVDGNHSPEHIAKDIELCERLSHYNTRLILDDYDGVETSVDKKVLDQLEIIEVAKCHNPCAVARFKR